jgi:hypothetical protein
MRRWPGVLGATVATVGLCGAGAPAATVTHNKIVFEGHGSYSLRYVARTGETFVVSASFRFKTVFPRALFSQSGAAGENLASSRASSYSGSWKASRTQPGHRVLCSGRGRFQNPASGTAPALLRYMWSSLSGRVGIHAHALPGDELATAGQHQVDCSAAAGPYLAGPEDFWHDWIEHFSQIGGTQHNAVTAGFEVPDSALTSARAIETFSPPPSKSLPGFCRTARYRICTQSYGWSGSMTFTKLP